MRNGVCFCCLAMICVGGCSALPTAGPTTSQLIAQASKKAPLNFALVEVDPGVVNVLANKPEDDSLAQLEADDKPPRATIGVGDTISVMIWDSPTGSIVGPPPGAISPGVLPTVEGTTVRNALIPDQVVAADGGISIPYGGRVHVAGHTPFEVEQTVRGIISKSSLAPEVLVTVAKPVSQDVTVSGETTSGMRVPLSVGGDRLLDVIAAAGGSKSAPYDTAVRLVRHDTVVTIPMEELVSDPRANIYAMPGDTITLLREPKTFALFGATSTNAQIPFGADRVDLAQAVAKGGGLLDLRADPEGVFLLRFEPPSVVAAMGSAVSVAPPAAGQSVPVVFHVNLRDVAGYFLARRIAMQDDDMIYVANAPLDDLQKFFTLVGTLTSPIITGYALRPSGH